jgi:hypothetical protein
MSHFKLVHDFPTHPKRFWEVFFDEPYNQALYEQIGVKERRWLEMNDTPEARSWVLRIMPKRDLPEFVKKLLKGDLGYVETSTLTWNDNKINVKIEPTLFTERTKIRAEYWLEVLGPNLVRRTFEGDIEVSMALIGRKIEDFIIADMTRAYQLTADFTVEWLQKHP